MGENQERPPPLAVDALLARARLGGPEAAQAARRAAALAEHDRPQLAVEALELASRLAPGEPEPRLELARVHAEAGEFEQAYAVAQGVVAGAVDQASQARAAFLLGEIARVSGQHAQAREHFASVLQIEDALLAAARAHPLTPSEDAVAARWYARARGRIADIDADAGAFAQALTGAEGALKMLYALAHENGEEPVLAADIADAERRMAQFDFQRGMAASARLRLNEAIPRYEALALVEQEEPHWRARLAESWTLAAEASFAANDGEAARAAIDKALQARIALVRRHGETAWSLAGTWRVRAALLAALDDVAGALESMAQARALAEQLATAHPGDPAAARFVVHTLTELVAYQLRDGNVAVAHAAADQARAIAEPFAGASPQQWSREIAECWDALAAVAQQAGAPMQALDAFARATEFRRAALDLDNAGEQARRDLAASLVRLGEAALAADALHTARAAFAECVSLRWALAQAAPEDARCAHALAVGLERLGLAAQAMGEAAAARTAWEEELLIAPRIFADIESVEAHRFCAIVESHLAGAGGVDAAQHRDRALAHFNVLAQAGAISEREAALRRKLWSPN